MKENEIVLVASESQIKINAVQEAFYKVGSEVLVKGINVESGVSNQPINYEETYRGAYNRLMNLQNLHSSHNPTFWISLENGLFVFDKGNNEHEYYDTGVCIIMDRKGRIESGLSIGVSIPSEIAQFVLQNSGAELGPYFMEKLGGTEKDPAFHLTNGRLKRKDILRDVVVSTILKFR